MLNVKSQSRIDDALEERKVGVLSIMECTDPNRTVDGQYN